MVELRAEGPDDTNESGPDRDLETDEEESTDRSDRTDRALTLPETGKQTSKQAVQYMLNSMLRKSSFLTVSTKALQFERQTC